MNAYCASSRATAMLSSYGERGTDRGSRAEREGNVEERRCGHDGLQLGFVHVATLGNAAREDREFQGIAAKRVRINGELVARGRPHLPLHFSAGVIDRHTVDRSVFGAAQTKIERQAIEGFQTLRVHLNQVVFDKRLDREIISEIDLETDLLQAQALDKIVGEMLLVAFYVFGGVAGNGGSRTVVEIHAMHADE